jgi:hypothetical protein
MSLSGVNEVKAKRCTQKLGHGDYYSFWIRQAQFGHAEIWNQNLCSRGIEDFSHE